MQNKLAQSSNGIAPAASHRGWINHILQQSFVDGPGNRAVVFLQGCNLHCHYCHNPYTINICNNCGLCVDTCPSGALTLVDGIINWDSEICTECDTCIHTCPSNSSPRATAMTAEDTWQKFLPSSGFISGVTLSGGEPILQVDFILELLALVKQRSSLTTLIETNGYAGPQAYRPLLEHLDMAIVDLKVMDPGRYRDLTGGELAPTLETIHFLHEKNKLHSVQQVVVPGFTDSQESAAATARFLSGIDPEIRLKFLRFRPHGTSGPAESGPSPSEEVMDRMVQVALQAGLFQVERSL
jgi:pyruvate formate lyase activating enzyme